MCDAWYVWHIAFYHLDCFYVHLFSRWLLPFKYDCFVLCSLCSLCDCSRQCPFSAHFSIYHRCRKCPKLGAGLFSYERNFWYFSSIACNRRVDVRPTCQYLFFDYHRSRLPCTLHKIRVGAATRIIWLSSVQTLVIAIVLTVLMIALFAMDIIPISTSCWQYHLCGALAGVLAAFLFSASPLAKKKTPRNTENGPLLSETESATQTPEGEHRVMVAKKLIRFEDLGKPML